MYIKDPFTQSTTGYIVNGNNYPLLLNIGKCLEYLSNSGIVNKITNVQKYTFSKICLEFLLAFLKDKHFELYKTVITNENDLSDIRFGKLKANKIRDYILHPHLQHIYQSSIT